MHTNRVVTELALPRHAASSARILFATRPEDAGVRCTPIAVPLCPLNPIPHRIPDHHMGKPMGYVIRSVMSKVPILPSEGVKEPPLGKARPMELLVTPILVTVLIAWAISDENRARRLTRILRAWRRR